MNTVKKLQDIYIEPLNISYVGSRDILSKKNKCDLIKILNKYQAFDSQSYKEIPSISTEKAVLLLQISNKKLNMSHLDDLSVKVLAKKVDQLARRLLLNTEHKSFKNAEVIDPFTDIINLPISFSLKFIHSFENSLLSCAKIGSSASAIALAADAIRDYKLAIKAQDDLAIKFSLFQGLYGTIQGILGIEALSLTFVNLIESNITTVDALTYSSAISGIFTVAYLNMQSAFNLYRNYNIMKPIKNILRDTSISDLEKNDRVAQYLQDQVSVTSKDIDNTYKYALEASQKNKNHDLLPKAEKYLYMADNWCDKNLHKLLDGSEEDSVRALEILEIPFKISLANELSRLHDSKIRTFKKYVGSIALQHIQSNELSSQELVEIILKESRSFQVKQAVVITLALLAGASLVVATIATGGISIAASIIFLGILSLVAYVDITNLISKLKDHMITDKEKRNMVLHIAFSLLIIAITIGIGVAAGAAVPIIITGIVVTILPTLFYTYLLREANRQREQQENTSINTILSHSL